MKKGTFTAEKICDIARPPGNGEVHPDLIHYKGHFYCQVQEWGGNRILRSHDGREWETVQLGRVGFMFSTTPRDELMMIGVTRTEDGQIGDSYTRFSQDGIRWGNECHFPAGRDTVMFRVDWHNGVGYSVAYSRKDATGTLYRTRDGIEWETVKRDFFPPNRAGNEASLAFEADGRAICLLRGDRKTPVTRGFSAGPEYTDWEWMVPQVDGYRDGNAVSADSVTEGWMLKVPLDALPFPCEKRT